MSTPILDQFPTMKKAILLMAHDSGCINRTEDEEKALKECELSILFAGINRLGLEQVEADLAQLTEQELETFCIGEASEASALWKAKGMLLDTERLMTRFFEAM